MSGCHVYLVPGFFGFDTLGSFDYFRGVASALRLSLRARGVGAKVFECTPRPTAFVKYRAQEVAQRIASTGGLEADEIHLIGHSTGALDVRQLLTPHVSVHLPGSDLPSRIAERTRSAVLLSGPHRGTRLAHFFDAINGRSALKVLASQASSRGRAAIVVASQILQVLARADDLVGRRNTGLDMFSGRLLRHISLDPNDRVWIWLRRVAADQGAMVLLTTEWMDHFNATVTDHPSVAYSSVVTAAPSPLELGLWDLLKRRPMALSAGYAILHALSAYTPSPQSASAAPAACLASIQEQLPFAIDERTNDGIVPTHSQPYGKVLGAVVADHLDTVGQFCRPGSDPYGDWLPSGSRFDESTFSSLWDMVAQEIAANGGQNLR